LGIEFEPPRGRHWIKSQEKLDQLYKEGKARLRDKITGKIYYKEEELNSAVNKDNLVIQVFLDTEIITDNWTDINGYSQASGFQTENSEILLKRAVETSSNKNDLILDFFLGSGTTTAVAHKLGRKWIGVEMGEHFYSVVLPRMKKVLAYDKSGISEEVKEYQGGGFFKYYELEQYEEALANCVYENHDLLIAGNKSPYEQYVFLKDEKMLKALEIDYENNKVKVDLSKLYENIDIAETLSNLYGKWIKRISDEEVEFEDGTKINIKDLDYKLIKPLIWWE
jgi:adenine specific DNA methylase Mod